MQMRAIYRWCVGSLAALSAAAASTAGAGSPPPNGPAFAEIRPTAEHAAYAAGSSARTDASGSWYAGLHAAGVVVPDTDFVGGGLNMRVDFDTGFALGGSVGYAYNFGPRIETELTFRASQARNIEVGGTPMSGSGNLDTLNLMLNGWFDVNFLSGLLGNWVPYFGGGAGVTHAWADIGTIGIPVVEAQDTTFAWQGGGGLAYKISDGLFVSADYRFFRTFGSLVFDDPVYPTPIKAKYKVHTITLGIRGHF